MYGSPSIILFFCLGIGIKSSFDCVAQDYSLHITPITFSILSENYIGYQTSFSLSAKIVKKEWWKYIQRETSIFNCKTHYVLTVPPKKGKSNTPMIFVSQFISEKKHLTLRVAPKAEQMETNQTTTFKKQLLLLLKDFKIRLYTHQVQQQIDLSEKQSATHSTKLKYCYILKTMLKRKQKKPNEKLASKDAQNDKKIVALKVALNKEEKVMAGLMENLKLIK